MASDKQIEEPFAAKDILFNCGSCGKSLVINALGAGLEITCPDCGAELQVPQSGGVEGVHSADESEAATTPAAEQEIEHELPEISDVLADAHEQISALAQENEELQDRRRFLEKRYAFASKNLQALRREMLAVRSAMERMEAMLKSMEQPPARDTQPIV